MCREFTSARSLLPSRPRQVRDVTGVHTRARPSTGVALSGLYSAQLAYPAPSRSARAQMRAVRALHNVSEGDARKREKMNGGRERPQGDVAPDAS